MPKKISETGVLPEAQQHSLACVLLGLCANLYDSYGSPDVPYRLKRLRECAEAASEQTRRKKRISRGAQRAWEKYADTLSAHTAKVAVTDAFGMWADLTWVAYCFSFDCRVYCPAYAAGPHREAWEKIHYFLDALAFEQLEEYPDCAERGCGIYEECAWALEGVEYKTPELYGV